MSSVGLRSVTPGRTLARVAALLIFSCFVPSAVRATCGSANCFLVTGTQEGVANKGSLVLDLSYRYVPQDRKLEGRHSTDEVLTPAIDFEAEQIVPDHHREIETLNTLVELDLIWGVSQKVSVTASLPLINQRYHEHFDDVGTPEEAFTNSAGTSGFGDVRVGARAALLVGKKNLLDGTLSVEAPTGPYRLHDPSGQIGEPTLMPGSGSTDFLAGLHYSRILGDRGWQAFASGGYKLNGRNPLDYQLGGETVLTLGAERRVGSKFNWSLQLNGRWTARDDYRGDSVPNTGAAYVNLTPGIRVSNGEGDLSFYLFAQVPVFQDVNEAQLAPRTGVMTGLSKRF
jgi:hypothetical protein